MSKRIHLLAGTNNKYEYGSEMNISNAAFTNCRFRLDKTNCECRNYCDCSAWADKVREDNARAKMGPKYEPDTARQRHNRHRVIPPNFLWGIKAINSMQAGNSEEFEFREYTARIATLPMRINERNKEIDCSEHHPMVTMEVFKNKVADLMMDIGELINSPLIAKVLEHYKKSDTTTNPGISLVSASKESRMMMRKYAQYCLENMNLAFLMGINKKTFYSVVYNLNGFSFSASNYKEVNIYQFISSIKSAVVCGDYYSAFGNKSKDEQAVFNIMDNDNEEVEGKVIKKGKKYELDMFLCFSAKDLLLEEDYEIEEMKEERMKRKREKEEDETKEVAVKSQKTSTKMTATTKVAASLDSRRDCNDDEFDFS
ncbi:hypothetical protein O3P69_006693 [Scylla paramamosain]|uniref:Uncharacterized protein n=1 Tax=Scylla paramamosain TaxID=85552 RepID=A0AAW0U552_SCYPA